MRQGRGGEVPADTLLPIAILAVVCTVAMLAVGPWPAGVFWDDGVYVALARSLATGHGLHTLAIPGAPAAIHYPPGYPAFLSLLWRLDPDFPGNVALFKLANALLLAVGATGAWFYARHRARIPPVATAIAVVVSAIAIPSLTVSTVVFSEPLFLALLAPTLVLGEAAAGGARAGGERDGGERDGGERDGGERDGVLAGIAAGAMAGVLALVRTVGIAVIPGIVAAIVVRRRRRAIAPAMAVVAAASLVLAPWQTFVGRHALDLPPMMRGNYGTYGAWLTPALHAQGPRFIARVAWVNVLGIIRIGRALFSPLAAPWIAVPFALLAVGVAALGARRLWPRAPVLVAGGAAYLMMVLVWPYYIDRFLWVVWPYVGVLLAAGAWEVAAWRAPPAGARDAVTPAGQPRGADSAARVLRWGAIGVCCIAAVAYARYNVRGFAHRWWESAERQQAELDRPVVEWVAAHTAPGDVIACEGEPLVHLYTGRPTIPTGSSTAAEYLDPQPLAEAEASLRAVIADYHPAWVIVSSGGGGAGPAAERLLRADPPELALVDTLPAGGAVFRPISRTR